MVDVLPTFDGLGNFFLPCPHWPAAVLDAVKRQLRWHEHFNSDYARHLSFGEQAQRDVGSWLTTMMASGAEKQALRQQLAGSERALLFGATRLLPFTK
jgi:hypothetical protein